MAAGVCVNQVYRDMRSDKQFRLLWLDPTPSGSYIYWLDGKPAIPARIQLSELEGAIQQGWIIPEQDPFKLKQALL